MIIAYVVATIVDSILGINHLVLGVYGPVRILLWLATLVPSIAVGVRRLHDTDRRGWLILLPVVRYLAALILGGAALMKGQMAAAGIAGIFMLIGMVCALVLLIFFVCPALRVTIAMARIPTVPWATRGLPPNSRA